MTTDVQPQEAPEIVAEEVTEQSEEGFLTEQAYTMSAAEFAGLKVAQRDVVLFLLLREMAGTVKALDMRVDEFEAKARELASPEGIQELMGKVMGGGGMFGGLLG